MWKQGREGSPQPTPEPAGRGAWRQGRHPTCSQIDTELSAHVSLCLSASRWRFATQSAKPFLLLQYRNGASSAPERKEPSRRRVQEAARGAPAGRGTWRRRRPPRWRRPGGARRRPSAGGGPPPPAAAACPPAPPLSPPRRPAAAAPAGGDGASGAAQSSVRSRNLARLIFAGCISTEGPLRLRFPRHRPADAAFAEARTALDSS